MKLPKHYLENLSPNKYREYLKLLPKMQKESTKAITMLIFTFAGLSVLTIFAINPTLTTIIELNKQLEDSEFVHQQLATKMNNLSYLQQQYDQLTDDIPFVLAAIPQNAEVPKLIGQIQALAEEKKVTITSLEVSEITLSPTRESKTKGTSYTFNLNAEGDYNDMVEFSAALTKFNRIVTIDSISLTKNQRTNMLILVIKGRAYFKN